MKPITTPIHIEKAFEEAIESSLLQKGGYIKGNPDDFNRELALDTKTIFVFLQESQPDAGKNHLQYMARVLNPNFYSASQKNWITGAPWMF